MSWRVWVSVGCLLFILISVMTDAPPDEKCRNGGNIWVPGEELCIQPSLYKAIKTL